ncbi:MAG: gliding motility-associated C-terminal domain-containing protein [Prevotella sp.]|nr:gliding motility-associated C-terminal domain-containing protein [Prevotella sp.]
MKTTKRLLTFAVMLLVAITTWADDEDLKPTINPTATYNTPEGEQENPNMSGSAPLTGRFCANPENVGAYTASYEWRFYLNSMEEEPYLVRYEQDTEYTFTKAGGHYIVCYATFVNGRDTVSYTKDYWSTASPLVCTINESMLEMPNAFSPNDDSRNDFYHPLKHQSLVEFHAYIFNRWGQKLYEWDNPDDKGWDGKFNGRDVKDGVYYVLVKAKGADGRKFNIRKAVNLLRGYIETDTTTRNE